MTYRALGALAIVTYPTSFPTTLLLCSSYKDLLYFQAAKNMVTCSDFALAVSYA